MLNYWSLWTSDHILFWILLGAKYRNPNTIAEEHVQHASDNRCTQRFEDLIAAFRGAISVDG